MSVNAPPKDSRWPTRLADTHGRLVRLTREINTGRATYPQGTLATVINATGWHRFNLRSEPCSHCSVKVAIDRVSWQDLTLMPAAD